MFICSLPEAKVYAQTEWGPWADFPLDPPLAADTDFGADNRNQ